jgi:hypothetical protein
MISAKHTRILSDWCLEADFLLIYFSVILGFNKILLEDIGGLQRLIEGGGIVSPAKASSDF